MTQPAYTETDPADLFRYIVDAATAYGVDLKEFIEQLNAAEIRHVKAFGEKEAFDELVTLGCIPEMLSTSMLALSLSRAFAVDWKEALSSSHAVRRTIKLFEKAALELERLYGMVSPDLSGPIVWPKGLSASPPEVIKSLRLYDAILESLLHIAPRIRSDYIIDVPRYLLTAYVHLKTHEFRDRPVAALISVALSTPVQSMQERFTDGEGQRVWRFRRWTALHEQLRHHLGLISQFEAFLAR